MLPETELSRISKDDITSLPSIISLPPPIKPPTAFALSSKFGISSLKSLPGWAMAPAFYRPGQGIHGICLFLLHRVADLRHKFIRFLSLVRADMIDVEHRCHRLIAIGFHPCNDSCVDVRDLCVAALVGAAGYRDLRKSTKLHMLRVGITAL